MLDAGGLGARKRMAADEPRIGAGRDDGPLGRADVGDHAIAGCAGQHVGDHRRERADGDGHEHGLHAGDRLREAGGRTVERTPRDRTGERIRGAVEAS